jgi:hypothetical protein
MEMEQIMLEEGRAMQSAAIDEAIELYLESEARGVTPLMTALAAAMLIGQIIGSAATDEAHIDEGLDHLAGIMRSTALGWLGMQEVRH